METPALPALRPLRLGELLDQAIRLYRRNFLTFIGIIAVVYVPLTILQTAASTAMTSSLFEGVSTPEAIFSNYTYWIGFFSTIILAFVQFVLVQGVATGAMTRAVADNYLGEKTSILDAYRGIGKSWLTLLGALIFVFLVLILITLWWIFVPCIGWFTGLGMLAFLAAAVNPMVAPVVVLETSGPWSSPSDNLLVRLGNWVIRSVLSVRRAWSLARRRFWPVLGTIFVLYLFSLIIVNGPVAIANFVLVQAFDLFDEPSMQLVFTSIIQALISLVAILIYYPLQLTAFTLVYFDLRVRTEGFDIALLTMASDLTDASQAMEAPALVAGERLITGPDLGNFAILTLAAAGIFILFYSVVLGSMFFLFALMGGP